MDITLIIIALILLAIVYSCKRRFGLLALAMIAGSIISANWSSYVTVMLQIQGVKLLSPPLNVVVAAVLIVLPAIFLLFVGPKYNKKWQRFIGALLFAGLGVFLIAAAIMREAPNLMTGNQIGWITTQIYAIVIVVSVVIAIGDTILAHLPRKRGRTAD